jgi:hypothetical protein
VFSLFQGDATTVYLVDMALYPSCCCSILCYASNKVVTNRRRPHMPVRAIRGSAALPLEVFYGHRQLVHRPAR